MAPGAAGPKRDPCVERAKREYAVWPSARASQAVAKCRKARGDVRRGEAGRSLRRWADERWVDQSGRPCGAAGRPRPGQKVPYCRPSRRASPETPATARELPAATRRRKAAEKQRVGLGARVAPVKRPAAKTPARKKPAAKPPTAKTTKKKPPVAKPPTKKKPAARKPAKKKPPAK